MHLHFVLHYFTPDNGDQSADDWNISVNGVRCERRTISVPANSADKGVSFRERRIWIGVRTATNYNGVNIEHLAAPRTMGFVVADDSLYDGRLGPGAWREHKLSPVPAAQGVVFFQTLVRIAVDEWRAKWESCISELARCRQIEPSDLIGSGSTARESSDNGQTLDAFRRHVEVLPRQILNMRHLWDCSYPVRANNSVAEDQRFDVAERRLLGENWDKMAAHVGQAYQELMGKIKKREEELQALRNNVHHKRLAVRQVPINISKGRNKVIGGRNKDTSERMEKELAIDQGLRRIATSIGGKNKDAAQWPDI